MDKNVNINQILEVMFVAIGACGKYCCESEEFEQCDYCGDWKEIEKNQAMKYYMKGSSMVDSLSVIYKELAE